MTTSPGLRYQKIVCVGVSINHVRFEEVGSSNEKYTVDDVGGGGGGVIQDITYIFFAKFFNL